MGKDLAELSGYQLQRIRLFDIFPHTAYYETLILLSKSNSGYDA